MKRFLTGFLVIAMFLFIGNVANAQGGASASGSVDLPGFSSDGKTDAPQADITWSFGGYPGDYWMAHCDVSIEYYCRGTGMSYSSTPETTCWVNQSVPGTPYSMGSSGTIPSGTNYKTFSESSIWANVNVVPYVTTWNNNGYIQTGYMYSYYKYRYVTHITGSLTHGSTVSNEDITTYSAFSAEHSF